MAEYLIQDTTLTGIADAIRAKTGKTDTMTAADMATEIAGIQAGGSSGVETVNIEINNTGVYLKVWYTDASYQFNEVLMATDGTKEITCIKNSPVLFSGYGFRPDISPTHSISYLYDPLLDSGLYMYHFIEDTSIYIENEDAEL